MGRMGERRREVGREEERVEERERMQGSGCGLLAVLYGLSLRCSNPILSLTLPLSLSHCLPVSLYLSLSLSISLSRSLSFLYSLSLSLFSRSTLAWS